MDEKKNKKIAITGADGYIGSNLREYFQNRHFDVYSLELSGAGGGRCYQADITNFNDVLNVVEKIKPDILIHTAGLSNLAQCECGKDKERAGKINVQGTRNIIEAIKLVNPDIKLIFISSDYVFDGERGNYKEKDRKNPKTFYGLTKAESEDDIENNLNNYIICRSANVYGRGGNFFQFILENLNQNKAIEVYDDVFYTPTYIEYLIDSLNKLIEKDFKGVIHVVGKERISRYQFALKMAEVLGKDKSLIKAVKKPEEGLIAKDSSLDSEYVQNLLENFCPTIEKSLHYCFGNLISPYFYFKDHRGKFLGIIQNQNWKEINYIESNKNSLRGNHYHKETREVFYIIEGRIKVTLINLALNSKKEFIVDGGDIFIVEPNTAHTFQVSENSKWINMLSKAMEDNNKDIFKV